MAQVLLSNNEGIVGVAVVTLPIPDKEYSKALDDLRELGIGDVRARDCYIGQIMDAPPVLDCLEGQTVNRYFVVDTYHPNVEEFIGQLREAYEALGLIDKSQYTPLSGVDLNGKVLVLSPDTLKEEYWTPKAQLWYAKGGFGCSPTARGRAVLATCIDDGETVFWNRQDFDGVLDEKYLPDWAKEKLQELRNPAPEQDQGMGGMEMK